MDAAQWRTIEHKKRSSYKFFSFYCRQLSDENVLIDKLILCTFALVRIANEA